MNRAIQSVTLSIAWLVAFSAASLAGDAPVEPPPRVVIVGNGIRVPGAYRFEANMTIMSAIGNSGGIGDNPRIYLIRDGKSMPVDLKAIQRAE